MGLYYYVNNCSNKTFIAAGYLAVPALSVSDAIALIDSFNLQLDGLVFNPMLPEAAEFVSDLHDFQEELKVIVAVESSLDLAGWSSSTYTTKLKPSMGNENEAAGWLTTVDLLLLGPPTRC